MKAKGVVFKLMSKAAPAFNNPLLKPVKRIARSILLRPRSPRRQPYQPGEYLSGVNLFGYLKAQMGLGQGARLYARAIDGSGIPYMLLNTTKGNPSKHDDTEWDGKYSSSPLYNTNILHINAEQTPSVCSAYPRSAWSKRYNIGVWLWELEAFPDEWKRSFRYVDEVWTPSNFTSRAVASVSPVPVVTIPYGINADIDPALTRRSFGLPEDQFLFLCMYDVNSMMERKNPSGAIDAYLRAFGKNNPDAGLVVKVNNAGEGDLAALRAHIGDAANIYLISDVFEKRGVNSLIRSCNALVSLHRSEGFGLVIAEAMHLGVPVVATGWSANMDIMNDANSCPVRYRLVDVNSQYYMPHKGQRWADPDLDHAAEYMKNLFNNAEYRYRIAEAGQHTILTDFCIDQCTKKIRKRLKEIGVI